MISVAHILGRYSEQISIGDIRRSSRSVADIRQISGTTPGLHCEVTFFFLSDSELVFVLRLEEKRAIELC